MENAGETSMETRERLVKLETNHANVMEKIDELKNDIRESNDTLLGALEKLENKLDLALEKKANVWVEKVLIWFLIFFATGVLSYIGMLIIKLIKL